MYTTTSTPDPIDTLQDLAARWHIHVDTVRRRIRAGELRAVRLSPRRVGVRRSEQERYLREREALPPAA